MKNLIKRITKFILGIFGTKFLINSAFEIIEEELVSDIPFAPLQVLVRANYDRLKIFAKIFIDKNPLNAEQVKEWFHVNKVLITDDAVEFIRETLKLEVKNPAQLEKLLELLDKIDPIPNDTLGNIGH